MRHIILISGKDSLAAALVQTKREPGLPYEYVFNDVEAELPETYEWVGKVKAATGWPIVTVGKSLPARIRAYHGFLPGPRSRYCTPECKIDPTEALIGRDECTVYYGLRADEARTGYVPIGKANITPAYPLRDVGFGLAEVVTLLESKGLMPPDFFWQRLYDAAAARLTDWAGWDRKLTWLERRLLFSGRTRGNCYFCFFQRQYEFLWLMETHPDLFAEAEALEKPGEYSFQPGFFLADLRRPEKAAKVFGRRVSEVVKTITGKFQGKLFGEPVDNELSLVSCGLLCGK